MARQVTPGPVLAPVKSVNGETGAVEASDVVDALVLSSGVLTVPLDASKVYATAIDSDVTFSVSGASVARSRVVQVYCTGDGARSFTFPGSWKWVGASPASIEDAGIGILSLTTFGAVVVAAWQDVGGGA